jgi:GrpB-like predicted nucleotidyltransferase (UPF0157 family)
MRSPSELISLCWFDERPPLCRATGGNLKSDCAVLIQDYDASWPETFSKLAARLKTALGSHVVAIEHVGSTAVPGLAAKPVIDLDIVLRSRADLRESIQLLAGIGYGHEGDLGIGGRDAFRSPPGDPRHHVYVLAAGAIELRRHLSFRDALRADNDRQSYTQAKSAFITSIVGSS